MESFFHKPEIWGTVEKKHGNKVCPWMHGSVSGFGPSFSSLFLLLAPRSSFLVFPPSPSFSFLLLPFPSASFLTLPHPSSSFLLVPPSSSSFLILLPFSSSLSLSPFLRRPAQCLPACSATANSHASGASLQNLWGSPAPRACRLLQLAGHKQYVPECNRTCQNACKTKQMSLNICQTECQTRCHIMRLRKEAL